MSNSSLCCHWQCADTHFTSRNTSSTVVLASKYSEKIHLQKCTQIRKTWYKIQICAHADFTFLNSCPSSQNTRKRKKEEKVWNVMRCRDKRELVIKSSLMPVINGKKIITLKWLFLTPVKTWEAMWVYLLVVSSLLLIEPSTGCCCNVLESC